MGNDGGSIPDRRDLVRNKPKAEQADKANQTRARWFFCALSKLPLQEPIVSCALGKLYNKASILEYLLDKQAAYGDAQEICGHVRSLKDVCTLKLTPNPASSTSGNGNDNHSAKMRLNDTQASERAPFVCPLTLKEMNGSQPFIYLSTCGCVFSLAGFKTITGVGANKEKDKNEVVEGEELGDKDENKDKASTDTETSKELCPQCAAKYTRARDIVHLNPPPEVEEKLRFEIQQKQLTETQAKAKANSKKRKLKEGSTEEQKGKQDGEQDGSRDKKKKKKKADEEVNARPRMHPSMAAASRAIASSLAMEEAKRKAGMSEAVKSIYEKDGRKEKETFMTMGTFTRYA